jgi:hypothetical protein
VTRKNEWRPNNSSREQKPELTLRIEEELGHIVLSNSTNLPRRTKKAAKKYTKNKPLTQLELSRLNAARRRIED